MIAAIVRSKASAAKWPAAIALLAAFVAEKAFGTPGKIVASFVAVVLTVRILARVNPAEALKAGLRFELGTALGRVAGRLITAVLLDPAAMVLGEALGEQVAALRSLQPSGSSSEASPGRVVAPATPFGARARVAAALAIALVLAGGLWRLRGGRLVTAAPSSWVPISGQGFTASAPAAMARSERKFRNVYAPAAIEHRANAEGLTLLIFTGELPSGTGPNGLLDRGLRLMKEAALPGSHSQSCGVMILGVSRVGDARCFTGPSGNHFVTACVVSPPGNGTVTDEEATFFESVQLTGGGREPLVTAAQLAEARKCSRELIGALRDVARMLGGW